MKATKLSAREQRLAILLARYHDEHDDKLSDNVDTDEHAGCMCAICTDSEHEFQTEAEAENEDGWGWLKKLFKCWVRDLTM